MRDQADSGRVELPLDSASTPEEAWFDYLATHRPKPSLLARTLLQLHARGEHEQVIAAIQAALIHGQGQPWMYDALALSMEITGRPQAEIERVLLSRVDFTSADVPSMLYSAAYLTRFGGDRLALRLYRQASRLEPTRPEPYILGLKLAQRLKDYKGIGWAASGILTTAWIDDYEVLHREAENAALEAEQELRQAGRNDEADALKKAIADALKRDLILRLTWAGDGDLDLLVEEPPGTVCSYQNPQTRGGGVLVHDGYGPDQSQCYEQYICARGVPGVYRVRIRYSWGNIVGKRAQLEVVRYAGTSQETVRKYVVQVGLQDTVMRLALKHGRRTELDPAPKQRMAGRQQQSRSRRSLLQMLGRMDPGRRRAGRQFVESRQRAAIAGGVGFQPIVTVLSEGTTLNAAPPIVSGDRRYVRLTIAPVFSNITDVFTFSFVNSGNPTGNPGLGGGGNVGGGLNGNNIGTGN